MKRALGSIFLVGFMIAFCLCYVLSVSCAINMFEQVDDTKSLAPEEIEFEDVEDKPAPAETKKAVVKKEKKEKKEKTEAVEDISEPVEEEVIEESPECNEQYTDVVCGEDHIYIGGYETPASPVYSNGSGLTRYSGVNQHNGRTETYYSSNVLYHYQTTEWTCGTDGVYRDADGYVVVAASDISMGSTVDTSFGAGKVYDTGCANGVTDIYTNW